MRKVKYIPYVEYLIESINQYATSSNALETVIVFDVPTVQHKVLVNVASRKLCF